MKNGQSEIVLYGLKNYNNVIDDIIMRFNLKNDDFDVRLILTEALTNAFKHGNLGDERKPIYLRCFCDDRCLRFEVEDCGKNLKKVDMDKIGIDDDPLEESGRGLFIIKSLSDKVEQKNNILVIYKKCSDACEGGDGK